MSSGASPASSQPEVVWESPRSKSREKKPARSSSKKRQVRSFISYKTDQLKKGTPEQAAFSQQLLSKPSFSQQQQQQQQKLSPSVGSGGGSSGSASEVETLVGLLSRLEDLRNSVTPTSRKQKKTRLVMQEDEEEQLPSRVKKELEQLQVFVDSGAFDFDEVQEFHEIQRLLNFEEEQPRYRRFTVLSRKYGLYEHPETRLQQNQMVLLVLDAETEETCCVLLRERWYQETRVDSGDVVHVVGEFDAQQTCVIDNARHFLIVNPDRLVSVTNVCGASRCQRSAVIREKLRVRGDPNVQLVVGNVMHEVFAEALKRGEFDDAFLQHQINTVIQRHLEDLHAVRMTEQDMQAHLQPVVGSFQQFEARLLRSYSAVGGDQVRVCKVLETEESIWSPMWGLTAKMDASLQLEHAGSRRRELVPLDLKTGACSDGGSLHHRAQVILYTLIMSDHYRLPVTRGLLYYSKTGDVFSVPAEHASLQSLVIERNTLAAFVGQQRLPPVLRNAHVCGRCFQKDTCALAHKAVDGGTASSMGLEHDAFSLSDEDGAFYAHWEELNRLEADHWTHFRSEVWALSSEEREEKGRCFSSMILEGVEESGRVGFQVATFRQQTRAKATSLLNLGIVAGDHVVLATEKGQLGVCSGFVREVRETAVVIEVRGPLIIPPLPNLLPSLDIEDLALPPVRPDRVSAAIDEVVWRIDKDNLSAGIGHLNSNLGALFASDAAPLRSLVVDLRKPRFRVLPEGLEDAPLWKQMASELDKCQLAAVRLVLRSEDYALILGFPGTGKTTTVAWLVLILVQLLQKTVLISGYTHTAVDNLLMKLEGRGVPFVRVARSPHSVHERMRAYTPSGMGITTVKEYMEAMETPPVVGATCLSVGSTRRTFDYCFVDEASQITLPACLGALRYSGVFVLVGDIYQLPPHVRNITARTGGLGSSLFRRLSEAHPQAVASLEFQYRMCADIMRLPNLLIYNQRLRSGTLAVDQMMLELPAPHAVPPGWVRDVLEPQRRVVFAETLRYPAPDSISAMGEVVQNVHEADIVARLLQGLALAQVPSEHIGVISPYRAQLKLIADRVQTSVELNTIDRCQGRDWHVVIISCVRSNPNRVVGDILQHWRRLNVALSRAKCKLIIVGSAHTLSVIPTFQLMLELCREHGWIYELPSASL